MALKSKLGQGLQRNLQLPSTFYIVQRRFLGLEERYERWVQADLASQTASNAALFFPSTFNLNSARSKYPR